MLSVGLFLLIGIGALKVATKNRERRAAEKVSLLLARSDEAELVEMLRKLVPEMTTMSVIIENIGADLFYFARPIAWCYEFLTFSTVSVDARTPSVTALWEFRDQLLELHDRDILDALDAWEEALRRDVFMLLALLLLAIVLIAQIR